MPLIYIAQKAFKMGDGSNIEIGEVVPGFDSLAYPVQRANLDMGNVLKVEVSEAEFLSKQKSSAVTVNVKTVDTSKNKKKR